MGFSDEDIEGNQANGIPYTSLLGANTLIQTPKASETVSLTDG